MPVPSLTVPVPAPFATILRDPVLLSVDLAVRQERRGTLAASLRGTLIASTWKVESYLVVGVDEEGVRGEREGRKERQPRDGPGERGCRGG